MSYIYVTPDLEVDVSNDAPADLIAIPLVGDVELAPLVYTGTSSYAFGLLVAECLSEIADQELSQATSERRTMGSAMIANPEPWLITLAYIIVAMHANGVTWDTIKSVVERALTKLQSAGVAPRANSDRVTARGFRCRWSSYIEIGKLFKLANKLDVKYDALTHEKKKAIPLTDGSKTQGK